MIRPIARLLTAALLLCVLGALLSDVAAPMPARAATPSGADIVFALDHSLSMADSDPQDLRVDGARRLVDTLATFTDSVSIRVGAIAFGSPRFSPGPHIVQPLTQVTDPELRNRIIPEKLSGTDFRSALCLSWATVTTQRPPADAECGQDTLFDRAVAVPKVGDPTRTRAVILLTDGAPAPEGTDLAVTGDPRACPGGGAGDQYMCNLMSLWQRLTQQTPVQLYVIGIDQKDQWFPTSQSYWRALTGCKDETECQRAVRRTTDPNTLASDVLQAATGGLTDLCKGDAGSNQCTLPAALAQVQFLIDGIGPNDTVKVFGPDNIERTESATVHTVTIGGAIRWRIDAPPRGAWKVQSSNPAARLNVQSLLFPGQLTLAPVPANPAGGQDVAIAVSFAGKPDVDIPSLAAQTFQLRLQRGGQALPPQQVTLRPEQQDRFIIDHAIPAAEPGQWIAVLELPVGGSMLQLGRIDFSVGPQAASTVVVTKAVPTIAPTPIPAVNPTAIPTAAPIQPCTPAAEAARDKVSLGPAGPLDPFEFAPHFSMPSILPIRFLAPREQRATWERAPAPAGCIAAPLPNGPVRLRLTVGPGVASEPACTTKQHCSWEVTGVGNGPLTVVGRPDGPISGWSTMKRRLEVDDGGTGTWRTVSEDTVLLRPSSTQQWRTPGIGYWLPLLALLVLLLIAIWGIAFASSWQEYDGYPLRDFGVVTPDMRDVSIIKLGAFVWQQTGSYPNGGTVSLAWFIFGPPVVRYRPEPDSIAPITDPEAGWDARARATLTNLRQHVRPVRRGELTERGVSLFDMKAAQRTS